ncbi:MAG: response regulator [Nitrospirae bacterium]|nr:response regulator [Nitrospirota bacterium]
MNKILLIIDDDAALLSYLCSNLERHFKEFTIMSAENGLRAAELLGLHPVDILITDLHMPLMDGFELLAHTAKNYPDVTLLVMSGNDSAEVIGRLTPFQVARCFFKPFAARELLRDLIGEIEDLRRFSGGRGPSGESGGLAA